jgi:predicted transposase YbfD/YdcC
VLPIKVTLVESYVSKHWTVENRLHWTLGVTVTEDANRIREGNGQEIMGGFRRLALSILKRDTSLMKESIRGKRLIAGSNNNVLSAIIAGS